MGAEFDRDIQLGKNSWYGVNGDPDTINEIHAPRVSTHARFTRRLGLLGLGLSFRVSVRYTF